MTIQTNLDLIWASTGGVTDPGDVKYQTGWISEIPTYQNFNFVLQNHAKNLLVAAEQGYYEWQAEIAYVAGVEVREAGKKYFCITDHTNQQPSLDTTNSYWIPGNVLGDALATAGSVAKGVLYKDAAKQVVGLWSGNDITIESIQPLISMASNGAGKNWLVGNVSGEMVMVDVGTTGAPDGRNIALGQAGVYRVYHEGHTPTQAEVSGTIPDSPQDGKLYARSSGNWVVVTSTTVSAAPPPPIAGAGQGWYNLDDGQFYLDINDGDSSQWVPANPPVIPQVDAVDVDFDSTNVIGSAATVQEELELLDSKIGRKNLLINGGFDVWQRTTSTPTANTYAADRWQFWKSGGGGVFSQIATLNAAQRALGAGDYVARFSGASGENLNIGQYLESSLVSRMVGKRVTFSLGCSASISTTLSMSVRKSTSTDAGAGAPWIGIGSGALHTVNVTAGKYSLTLDIPDDGTVTSLSFMIGADALANGAVVDVFGVQAEFGDEATDFEVRNVSEELALCQRYYYQRAGHTVPALNLHASNTQSSTAFQMHPVEMRVVPTMGISAGGVWYSRTPDTTDAGTVGSYSYAPATFGWGGSATASTTFNSTLAYFVCADFYADAEL